MGAQEKEGLAPEANIALVIRLPGSASTVPASSPSPRRRRSRPPQLPAPTRSLPRRRRDAPARLPRRLAADHTAVAPCPPAAGCAAAARACPVLALALCQHPCPRERLPQGRPAARSSRIPSSKSSKRRRRRPRTSGPSFIHSCVAAGRGAHGAAGAGAQDQLCKRRDEPARFNCSLHEQQPRFHGQ